jgi:FixJ family two-component response regulator
MPQTLSDLERRVLTKLLEGLPPKEIGRALQLSDTNVRFGINKLKWRYQIEKLDELLSEARSEIEQE